MIKKVTARMVREHASQVHGLEFSIARCEELARDLQRHTTAVAAASPVRDSAMATEARSITVTARDKHRHTVKTRSWNLTSKTVRKKKN